MVEKRTYPPLKPCPFCGKRQGLLVCGNGAGWTVECEGCTAMGPDPEDLSQDEAAAAWNGRA
jgi:hypothetical protein